MNPPILPCTKIQYSLTVDDSLAAYRFIYGYRNRKFGVYIRLFLYNFLSAIGVICLTSLLLNRASMGYPMIMLTWAGILGIATTVYVVRSSVRQFGKTVLQRAKLHSRHERGDFQHNVLQISNEGLIEETPTNRALYYWEDGIELHTLDKDRTAIMLVNGWGSVLILPAKGIEVGDYQQFLADVRRMAELHRHPQKSPPSTSAAQQEDDEDTRKEVTHNG
jgi:hypothetical protein